MTCSLAHPKNRDQPSLNGALTIFVVESWIMRGLGDHIIAWSNYRQPFQAKLLATTWPLCLKNNGQRSINDEWPRILHNRRSVWPREPIIEQSAAFLGKNTCNSIASMSYQWASTECRRRINGALMECEQLSVLQVALSNGCTSTWTCNQSIGPLYGQTCR